MNKNGPKWKFQPKTKTIIALNGNFSQRHKQKWPKKKYLTHDINKNGPKWKCLAQNTKDGPKLKLFA